MSYFFRSMGFFLYPLTLIAAVVLILTIRKIYDLYLRRQADRQTQEKGLHAILFWGSTGLVMGVLGQATGLYNALRAISRATEISLPVVARGLAESYTTTIFGLEIFMVSGLLWFWLRSRLRKSAAQGS